MSTADATEGALPEGGNLWARAEAQRRRALASGALMPIPTECRVVDQDGIGFLVRVLAPEARQEQVWKRWKPVAGQDPFLPYDPDLFVADLDAGHVCLLNKFCVVEHHLLVVTRDFVEQETLLEPADFAALWPFLVERDGLVFYNAGAAAGASQRHKHLQVVPLPLAPLGAHLPIEPLLETASPGGGRVHGLPFAHALGRMESSPPAEDAAAAAYACYGALMAAVGLQGGGRPYNLLATRRWMLVVPRSQESWNATPVNALGFAGAFLMRSEEQRQAAEAYGLLRLLRSVGVAE